MGHIQTVDKRTFQKRILVDDCPFFDISCYK